MILTSGRDKAHNRGVDKGKINRRNRKIKEAVTSETQRRQKAAQRGHQEVAEGAFGPMAAEITGNADN